MITIVDYDHTTFIAQATGASAPEASNINILRCCHNLEHHSFTSCRDINYDLESSFMIVIMFIVQAKNCGITYEHHLWS